MKSLSLLALLVWGLAGIPPSGAEVSAPSLDRNGDGEIVVACLGDSNTASGWQYVEEEGFPPESGWCEQLPSRIGDPRVRSVNMGVGGASVISPGLPSLPEERIFFGGPEQLEAVLGLEPVDVVVFAFGTNDVLPERHPVPSDIVDEYNRLWRRVRSDGRLGLVATTPPVFAHRKTGQIRRDRSLLSEVNERIRETFPPRVRLDFEKDMAEVDYLDDLHMNARGQAKRAEEVARGLLALSEVMSAPAGVRHVTYAGGHWGPGAD